MLAFLIRHAHALEADDDYSRALSSRGRGQVERLIRHFRANGELKPQESWHSPLVRARETARLLADGLGWTGPRRETEALEPNGDPEAVLRLLQGSTVDLALVGHEPLLSILGTMMLQGPRHPVSVRMGLADVLCAERSEPGGDAAWVLRWQVGPGLLDLG
jgi:phosphohistidine phosphatase